MSDIIDDSIIILPETIVEKYCYEIYKFIHDNREALGFPVPIPPECTIPVLYSSNDLIRKFENFIEICATKNVEIPLELIATLLEYLLLSYETQHKDPHFWHSKPQKYIEDLVYYLSINAYE
jgi:hypothetical protein